MKTSLALFKFLCCSSEWGDFRVKSKPYVFLITSTVRTSEQPLSYTAIRSVFSSGERMAQTLDSIQSVRAKVPEVLIVMLENSNLPAEEADMLAQAADWFVSFDHDEYARSLRDGPYKGAGEVYMLLSVQRLLQCFAYTKLFKLSGRYRLTDRFDIANYPNDRFGVLKQEGVHSTRLYSVPKSLEILYAQQLRKALAATQKGTGVEAVLMRGVPTDKVRELPFLGVCGQIGVTGDLIDE